jgi:hypothetical protein
VTAVADPSALQQLLLARLAGEGQDDDTALTGLLEQQLGDNPSLAPVLEAVRRREASRRDELPDGASEAADPTVDPAVDEMTADVLERLYAEVEELRLRNRTAAAALGACRRCWGEAPDCPVCHGRGRPGGRSPDPVLYHELVEPAVRRRARQERALAQSWPGRGEA